MLQRAFCLLFAVTLLGAQQPAAKKQQVLQPGSSPLVTLRMVFMTG
jgi:hypothetical protein